MAERFEKRLQSSGGMKTQWLFARDVLLLFRPGIIRPVEGSQKLNQYGMFKNYFKVGVRNILRYKTFSFINIFGLAVAMSVSLLIILMLAGQYQRDKFHTGRDYIFRVVTQMAQSSKRNASCPMPLAEEMKADYPMVAQATRLVRGVGGDLVFDTEAKPAFAEVRGFFADPAFFEVFSFDLVEGEKGSALNAPNTLVITSRVAEKLFNGINPVGQTVRFLGRGLDHISIDLGTETGQRSKLWGSFIITGVVDEKAYKTHLKFDVLMPAASLPSLYQKGLAPDHSADWDNHSHSYAYFLLSKQADKASFQEALDEITSRHSELDGRKLIAQTLDEVVLGDFLGNPVSLSLPVQVYYFLGMLAVVVLLSAGLNYTNLSIARAMTRVKEIGVRKVNGALRGNLMAQFLLESVMTSSLALVLANLLLLLLKPGLENLWAVGHLGLDLGGNLPVYLIFLGFALAVGIASGLYPALILSRFAPVKVLKSSGHLKAGKSRMRALLNVSQFALTFFFIVSSLLIARQFRHFVDFDYGMNVENIVNINLQGNDHELLMAELSTVPGVVGVSACEMIPAMPNSHGRAVELADGKWFKTEFQSIHPNLIANLGLKLVAGSNLKAGSASQHAVVVNEYAVREMGLSNNAEAIGLPVTLSGIKEPFQIVGVIQDFKFQSPISGEGDRSLVYHYQPENFSYLNVKLTGNDIYETLSRLESKWEAVDPVHPMSYHLYDESLAKANYWLGDLAKVIGFIALLAIVISCLGLLGMAVYNTERRTKEIGIRKVLGARIGALAFLLGKSYVIFLLVAIFVAAPLSYAVNSLWLDSIPNRIPFGLDVLLLSSLLLLLLGLATIVFQVFSVAKRNPVESLRYE